MDRRLTVPAPRRKPFRAGSPYGNVRNSNGGYTIVMSFDWRRLIWRGTGHLLGPLVHLWLYRRAARGKESPVRLSERFGHSTVPRPAGTLVWCHGASVGEAQALLPLLQHLHALRPDITLLLTTGTVTSATLVTQRIADGSAGGLLHQFVPVDLPGAVDGFLNHWHPDLVLWSESDFWPGILSELRRRKIPALLVNARMSERSCQRWQMAPGTARWLIDTFAAIYAQTAGDADRLRRLGAAEVTEAGNLKQAAPPLPVDETMLGAWRERLQGRPLWLVASTHPGEEALIATAHRVLKTSFPNLLTLLAPRHPDRGPALREDLAAPDLRIALRSAGEEPAADTDLYIIDTLGELGLWFRLSPVVMMGGSLIPHGGHNPLEPARLGCAVLFGPHMFNFTDATSGLLAAGGAVQVADAVALANSTRDLLLMPERRAAISAAAKRYTEGEGDVIATLSDAILHRLPSA
jgi:3-deoxy-D-manno-octulosonic-acid transferase